MDKHYLRIRPEHAELGAKFWVLGKGHPGSKGDDYVLKEMTSDGKFGISFDGKIMYVKTDDCATEIESEVMVSTGQIKTGDYIFPKYGEHVRRDDGADVGLMDVKAYKVMGVLNEVELLIAIPDQADLKVNINNTKFYFAPKLKRKELDAKEVETLYSMFGTS